MSGAAAAGGRFWLRKALGGGEQADEGRHRRFGQVHMSVDAKAPETKGVVSGVGVRPRQNA